MKNKSTIAIAIVLASLLSVSGAIAAKPEAKWRGIGKKSHSQVRHKSSKDKNRICTAQCRKSGAKKSRDLGACKEGCFFG